MAQRRLTSSGRPQAAECAAYLFALARQLTRPFRSASAPARPLLLATIMLALMLLRLAGSPERWPQALPAPGTKHMLGS